MSNHVKSIALMKFLSGVARAEGVAKHVYVVGGAVRNYLLGVPIKDIDVVVDSVSVGQGRDSEWFARKVADAIPVPSNLTTNQYGVAILTVKGEWVLDGVDLKGEVIEIANARKESYDGAGGKGKGYKPTDVSPATIEEDVLRREFSFNTLLWRLLDLAHGPDKAEVIDLTGLGRKHLEERLIATPVDPDKTFRDDPTRQLRILKFLLRYDLKISPDVVASVKRNAHRLKDMPWESVGNILVGDILKSAKATTGILVMKSLGILDVLVEMIQETPPFAAYLTKQLANGNHSVELLLELADLGIAGRVLSFLTTDQRARFKELAQNMGADESRQFLEVLRVPPVDNAALIQEFSLEGRDRGLLVPIAREAILLDPSLATHEVKLNGRVREALRATRALKVAASPAKYDHIDFKPPQSVADAAAKGLEYRAKASPSNKGGLTPAEAAEEGIGSGVQRAVNLKNRDNISPEVINQMAAFFSRHEKNKGVAAEHRDEPWNDKGNVAWLIWGGDPGRAWAEKIKGQMETADGGKTASVRLAFDTKRWGPFTFEIDRPKGFVKTWDQPDGSVKKFKYPCDYGYFVDHTGEDNEGLDAFVGDDPAGKIESFLKMRRDDQGNLVPDETKFMIGLSDSQREKVIGLYHPDEIVGLQEYTDFYKLIAALNAFRDRKKQARMEMTRRVVAQHLEALDPLVALTDEVRGLESLASEIQAVVDTFLETVPMPHVGRIAAIQLRSQTECSAKCEHAARHAQRVINKAFTILQTTPGNATATAVARDAGMLLERFDTYRVKSREMLSALSQKIMPSALKATVTYTLDGVRAELYEPNRMSVTVFPHYVPTKVGDSMVDGMVFDAYLTVSPNPTDIAEGLPKYQQFVLTQSTIGDTDVYLKAIDRTNVLDPTAPVAVGAPSAVTKILGYLGGWDNLLSVHSTSRLARVAAAPLTRLEVAKFLATELKKIPGVKVRVSKGTLVMVPGPLNPEVATVEFTKLDGWDTAPFKMTLKNGMSGWGWDGYRKPPVFTSTHNTLKIRVVFDGKRDPATVLRAFIDDDLLPQIKGAGKVRNGEALVPMVQTPAPASRAEPTVAKEFLVLGDRALAEVQSRFGEGAHPWTANDSRVDYPEVGSQLRVIHNNSFQDAGAEGDLRSITLVFRYDAAPGGGKGVARYFAYRNDLYKNNHEWYSLANALKEIRAFLDQAFPPAPKVPTPTLVKLVSAMSSKIEAAVKWEGGQPVTHLSPSPRVGWESGYEIARYSLTWEYDGRRVGAEMWIRRPLDGGKPEFSVERVTDLNRLPGVEMLARGAHSPAKVIKVFTRIVDDVAASNAADKTMRDRARAERAEKERLEREEQERVKRETPRDYMEEITDALKRMRLGPVGGRVVDVDYYPGVHPSWSVEPSNRQRLDHYVGANYYPEGDDDPEGWDEDGWNEEYAEPIQGAALAWLADAFGSKGLFYVEVGEKGHIDIQLTDAGRKKFLP